MMDNKMGLVAPVVIGIGLIVGGWCGAEKRIGTGETPRKKSSPWQ